eukprot:Blabericola_migrator_1__8170@NODE_421_length_8666_cov_158_657053_g333_i0_p2_GENE_NODE_421_length_8666_cov_158_657053_g333_i0NODE_421_length_8666_cov_158_657053_g333_i0_p2_ORF_typecomplete_len634_score120_21PseudoU_synth_1/PF01416_20/0_53PseudoU_synth_1/PF01416_20/9_6e03PseudoU_synth_1/PF01416_20/1e13TMA7/PF09072_10/0_31_NODE_421_length_8666_cov_158_657053_g333_i034145315
MVGRRKRPVYQGRRQERTKIRKVEDDDPHHTDNKIPKRKYALIFGYEGTAYNGLQKQTDEGLNGSHVTTVEGALLKALTSINSVSDAQMDDPLKLHWARVGRTDAGVHAVSQVISAKLSLGELTEEDKAFIEKQKQQGQLEDTEDGPRSGELQKMREKRFLVNLQAALPNDIKIFDVARVWGTWDARGRAQRRVYEYVLPARALQKMQVRDTHQVFLSFCKESGMSEEEAERLFCPVSLKAKLCEALKKKDESILAQLQTDTSDEGLATIALKWAEEIRTLRRHFFRASTEERAAIWNRYGCALPEGVDKPAYPPVTLSPLEMIPFNTDIDQEYTVTDEQLNEFREILKQHHGSHHWFNFTSRVGATDPTGQRFIESIEAHRASCDGETFIVVRIVGQSFLLNQIRKMMASALETYVGTAPYYAISHLLRAPLEPKKHLHVAPGEGLMLERVFFDHHDRQRREGANRSSTPQLMFYDSFELKYPYDEKMDIFLETGEYPEITEQLVTFRGLLKKPEADKLKHNLLLDEEEAPAPPSETKMLKLDFSNELELPTWAKMVLFKRKTLFPRILRLFKEKDVWRRYFSDVIWHPFALENFPEPIRKAPLPTENSETLPFETPDVAETNDASDIKVDE